MGSVDVWSDGRHAFRSVDHAEASVRLSWHKKSGLVVVRYEERDEVTFSVRWDGGAEMVVFQRVTLYDTPEHL